MFESVFLPAWLATFAAIETPPTGAPTTGVARGEYLTRAVSHCGECHTPADHDDGDRQYPLPGREPQGQPGRLRGAEHHARTATPGSAAGREEQITDYLETGNKPDGDVAGGLMAEVIQGSSAGYKDLTKADRLAIAKYLKSIPPIKNKIE